MNAENKIELSDGTAGLVLSLRKLMEARGQYYDAISNILGDEAMERRVANEQSKWDAVQDLIEGSVLDQLRFWSQERTV